MSRVGDAWSAVGKTWSSVGETVFAGGETLRRRGDRVFCGGETLLGERFRMSAGTESMFRLDETLFARGETLLWARKTLLDESEHAVWRGGTGTPVSSTGLEGYQLETRQNGAGSASAARQCAAHNYVCSALPPSPRAAPLLWRFQGFGSSASARNTHLTPTSDPVVPIKNHKSRKLLLADALGCPS